MFRPEFLNRIDEVIEVPSLTQLDVKEIVDLLISGSWTSQGEGPRHRADRCRQGAARGEGIPPGPRRRPLRWTIQRLVEDPLSRAALQGVPSGRDRHRPRRDGEIFSRGATPRSPRRPPWSSRASRGLIRVPPPRGGIRPEARPAGGRGSRHRGPDLTVTERSYSRDARQQVEPIRGQDEDQLVAHLSGRARRRRGGCGPGCSAWSHSMNRQPSAGLFPGKPTFSQGKLR